MIRKKIDLKYYLIILAIVLIVAILFFGKTFSRYYDSLLNDSDLPLAPWVISINDKKVTKAGETNIIVSPVVTETTTLTNTYQNKIVPGCKGYFDIEINPTGTGVSINYIIDFKPTNLPGGMTYVKYDVLDENKEAIVTSNTFPENSKLIGTIPLIDKKVLGTESILRFRIYWDYKDDDSLNTINTDADNQSSILVGITLKQTIA